MKSALIILFLLLFATGTAFAQQENGLTYPDVKLRLKDRGFDSEVSADYFFEFRYWQPYFEIGFGDENDDARADLNILPGAGFKYILKPGTFLKFWVEYGSLMLDYGEFELNFDKGRSVYSINLEIAW